MYLKALNVETQTANDARNILENHFICNIRLADCYWNGIELPGKELLIDREELLLALDMEDLIEL